jgi:DNA-binding Lrp family transcriptional regulator
MQDNLFWFIDMYRNGTKAFYFEFRIINELCEETESLKEFELKLIAELMKNSRRSDRELGRALGVSQPTVTRVRRKLEREGIIKEYTMIPDFPKLGYELMNVTFINVKQSTRDELEHAREGAAEEVNKKVFPDLLIERGLGLGFDGIIITLHRSYTDYTQQIKYTKTRPFVQPNHVESFLVDLTDPIQYRNLTLSLVADDLVKRNREEKKGN